MARRPNVVELAQGDTLAAETALAVAEFDARPPMMTGEGILDGIPFTIPVLALTNVPTGDGRLLKELSAAPLPLPLQAQFENNPGHDGAVVAGKITSITLGSDGTASASGVYAMTADGMQAAALAASQMMTGISVDLDSVDVDYDEINDVLIFNTARIRGATQLPIAAFAEACIVVTQADIDAATGMVASGTPVADVTFADDGWRPPRAWFTEPELDGPTALTFTPSGEVIGHLALWNSCHTTAYSETGECLSAPESMSGYAYFMTGQIETDDGQMVACGNLTFGTGHAPKRRANGEIMPAAAAKEHYDDSGHIGAYLRVGQDAYGIWVHGAMEPDLTAKEKRQLLAAKLSGDWRMVAGNLELIGALAVPKPAFPVPSLATSGRDCVALVAAGAVPDAAPQANGAIPQALLDVLYPLAADAIVASLTE